MTALITTAGERIDLAVDRWRTDADDIERALLADVPDPVLDVGCGPGRIVAALAGAGRIALGVDPSAVAVDEAGRRGAPALRRSVFDPLPGERRWGTVLLLDGNVGIGGDPAVLLARAAALLRPGGVVVTEVDPPGRPTQALIVRVEAGHHAGPWFPWAQVGADDFGGLAAAAGLRPSLAETHAHRWFVRAVKR